MNLQCLENVLVKLGIRDLANARLMCRDIYSVTTSKSFKRLRLIETLPTHPHSSFRVGRFLATMKVAVDLRGEYVAAYNDGNLLLWNVAEKRLARRLHLRHIFVMVTSLKFAERGDLIVTGPSTLDWKYITHIYTVADPPIVPDRSEVLKVGGKKLCKISSPIDVIELYDNGVLYAIDANRALVGYSPSWIAIVTIDGTKATAEPCLQPLAVGEYDIDSWHYRVLSDMFPARYPVWYSKKKYVEGEGGALADNGILQFVPSDSTICLASKRPVFFNPENINLVATLKDGDTVEIFASPHYFRCLSCSS